MSLVELIPIVRSLPRCDQIRLIQVLAGELAGCEGSPSNPEGLDIARLDSTADTDQMGSPTAASRVYPYWSPDREAEAATLLMSLLKEEKSAS